MRRQAVIITAAAVLSFAFLAGLYSVDREGDRLGEVGKPGLQGEAVSCGETDAREEVTIREETFHGREAGREETVMGQEAGIGRVTGVSAQPRDGGVKLSWDPVEGADGYCVFKYKDMEYRTYKFTEKPAKSFSGLNNGEEYQFAVAAYVLEGDHESYGRLSLPITVTPANDKLKISDQALMLSHGESRQLFCTLHGEKEEMEWSSSDPFVASVDDQGMVTAVGRGRADITGERAGVSCSCSVYVDREAPKRRVGRESRYRKNSDGSYTNGGRGNKALLMFTGDLMAIGPQMKAAEGKDGWHDFSPSFSRVSDLFARADLVVGNLETTLSESFPYASESPVFMGISNCNAPSSYLDALKTAGFDMLVTANNHYCDAGPKGLVETLDHLDEYGFMHLGTYRDSWESRALVAEVNSIKVGILNYNQKSPNGKDKMFTEKQQKEMLGKFFRTRVPVDIAAARELGAEFIVVYIHYGTQNSITLSETQQSITLYLADCGADLIVGSHPHLLQRFEIVTGELGRAVPVAYSMGNFCSSMADLTLNQYNIILNVSLEKGPDGAVTSDITYTPCCILRNTPEGEYVITPTWRKEGLAEEQLKELSEAEEAIIELIGSRISPVLSPAGTE